MSAEKGIVELTGPEKRKLLNRITGYGKLRQAAIDSGLHANTLRNISKSGYGELESVLKLRSTIFSDALDAKVDNITENCNTAA